MSFGLATRLLAEQGIEMTPADIETMVRGWIQEFRKKSPVKIDYLTDVDVFELFVAAFRQQQEGK